MLFFYLQLCSEKKKKDGSQWVTDLLKSTKNTEHLLNVRRPASETEDSGEQDGGSDFKEPTKQ